jgi:site-specific DNA-cytosine methylase
MKDSMALRWDERHAAGLARPLRLASACSGMCTELFACKALGIPFDDDVVTSERNTATHALVRANLPEVLHQFNSLVDHGRGHGCCTRHGRVCQAPCKRDLLVIGPPCQPFSSMRHDTKQRDLGCKAHALYNTTFGSGGCVETDPDDSAIELIKSMLPSSVLVEQVEGFGRIDLASGTVPMEEFSEMVLNIRDDEGNSFYKAARAFKLNASLWLGINRPRFIAGLNTPQV